MIAADKIKHFSSKNKKKRDFNFVACIIPVLEFFLEG